MDVIGIDLSRDTIFAIMIHEDELPAFMEEVRRRALLACDNKPEYVRALRESRLGTGSGTVKSVTGRTLAIGTISLRSQMSSGS